ncbi:MAG TPA: hypothetical protein VIS48_05330 [Candidatus Kryptonia bacterium]
MEEKNAALRHPALSAININERDKLGAFGAVGQYLFCRFVIIGVNNDAASRMAGLKPALEISAASTLWFYL